MNLIPNNECSVTIDLPYPPIQTECRCSDYAYAMLSNIGSDNSEMSAVCLYFYNSVILNPSHEELAECFHKISVVEMHHLHIFASLASQMGLDPRLWSMQNHRRSYWSPAYNSYPRSLKELIENSIKGELAAIQKYTRQSEIIRDADIVEILDRIILDEQRHVELFHLMLDKCCCDG